MLAGFRKGNLNPYLIRHRILQRA